MSSNYANMSMLEVAEYLMQRKKTPQSFRKIAQEVSELMGMKEQELKERITQFYADLTLSGKFVNISGDKWDLKGRQKYEVYEHQFIFDDDSDDLEEDIEEKEKEKEEEEEDDDEEDLDKEDAEEEYEEEYNEDD